MPRSKRIGGCVVRLSTLCRSMAPMPSLRSIISLIPGPYPLLEGFLPASLDIIFIWNPEVWLTKHRFNISAARQPRPIVLPDSSFAIPTLLNWRHSCAALRMKTVLQLLGAALAYSRIVSAQHVDGNVGANNQSTPHVVEGDHVVHFVTVGKATNNFEVPTCYHLVQNNAERLRSQTVFVRVQAT